MEIREEIRSGKEDEWPETFAISMTPFMYVVSVIRVKHDQKETTYLCHRDNCNNVRISFDRETVSWNYAKECLREHIEKSH